MRLFSPMRMLRVAFEQWSNEQGDNNPEAVDLAKRKIKFINDHGSPNHNDQLKILLLKTDLLMQEVFMLPLGTDPSNWEEEQAQSIHELDTLIRRVEEHSGNKFS